MENTGITAGKYEITPFIGPDNLTEKVLIQERGGDNMVFDVDEFEKVVAEFYNQRRDRIAPNLRSVKR